MATVLTFNRSTFLSHDVFMYFLWFLNNGNYFLKNFIAHQCFFLSGVGQKGEPGDLSTREKLQKTT